MFAAGAISSEVHTVPYPPSMDPVSFDVPDYAMISGTSITVTPAGQTRITVSMKEAPPANRTGRWAVELFFASPYVTDPYTLGILYLPAGGDGVSNVFQNGTAWLVDLRTKSTIAQLTPEISGTSVTFILSFTQIGASYLVWTASRYLPSELTEINVSDSLVSLKVQQQQGTPPRRPGRFPFPYELPKARKPIQIPDTSPVGDPSKWRDEDDVNGDGRTDYDLEPDTPITGDWLVGVWVIDLPFGFDEYAVFIGRDLNGNGRLDANEILYQVGQCPLPGGMDQGDVYVRPDGSFVVVWEVQQPHNNGAWVIRFVYDSAKPIEVRLRVYVQRGDGQPWELVWVGNPLLYPWNDHGSRVGHDFPDPMGPPSPEPICAQFSHTA